MHFPSLHNLHSPPPNKTGWPWTEESQSLPEKMPNGAPWPRISVVTPSFNQAKFIEETIRSVLLQGYPNLEYIIIDGGSTDGSVDIIRKYEPWLAYWVSEPDRGQSHAINKGFQHATGDILAYLNSDDIYYPNSLAFAASQLTSSNSDILIGAMNIVELRDGQTKFLRKSTPHAGEKIHAFPIFSNGRIEHFHFIQPPMFWRRAIWCKTGEMNTEMHYTFDREWCLRTLAAGAAVATSEEVLARFARHPGSKTQEDEARFVLERAQMYLRFSRMAQFRRLPCLLDSVLAYLRYRQDYFYGQHHSFCETGQRHKALVSLWAGRFVRRARLGINRLSKILRTLASKQQARGIV